MNLEREIKINKILLILLITLSVGTIVIRSSYAMFSKKETFNNVLRIITGNELPKIGIDNLIEKAGTGKEEIQGIDPESGTICETDCKEYRYIGPSVKNYAKLNNNNQDELWRIIGIFTDEDTNEKYIRIVRDEFLPESYLPTSYIINGVTYKIKDSGVNAYWHNKTGSSNDKNDWSIAGLQYYLNSETDDGSNKGYMRYLSDETKSMLRDTKHYLGAFTSGSSGRTTVSSYLFERYVKSCVNNKGEVKGVFPNPGCNVWNGNTATWTGKISLMYPSDVGFAASSNYWRGTKLYSYYQAASETSWIFQTLKDTQNIHSWLLSPTESSGAFYVTILAKTGSVSQKNVYSNSNGVRPVLNIKSDVKIVSGTGSSSEPYIFKN